MPAVIGGLLILTACAAPENRPAPLKSCPADYVQVGRSCLFRAPAAPAPWLEADKFCKRIGDVVATPETLQTALQAMPNVFRPSEKTHWSARGSSVFVMNLEQPGAAGEGEDNRLQPIEGPRKYSVSHGYRCEKFMDSRPSGADPGGKNVERCLGCMEDAETCSMVLEIFSCLLFIDRVR